MSDAVQTTAVISEPARTRSASAECSNAPCVSDRRLGTLTVVLIVLAYIAPLGWCAALIPLAVAYGNGIGVPLTFLAVGVGFGIFSVGYVTMTRTVDRPGAFYAYISAGLGKRVGLGGSFLSLTFYVLGGISGYAFAGLTIRSMLSHFFGLTVPWWAGIFVALALVSLISYRGIELSARIMAAAIMIELAIITVFVVGTMVWGGPEGRTLQPFTFSAFTSGSLGAGLLFVTTVFVGFESTVIYRAEVKDPQKTIAHATYYVIAVIALLYTFASWSYVIAFGPDAAVGGAKADLAGSFAAAVGRSLGPHARQMVSVLTITSLLASEISVANIISRYLYSLGVDRVLPESIGTLHPRFGSPARASLLTAAVMAAALFTLVMLKYSPEATYILTAGITVYSFEILVALVSLAIVVYYLTHARHGISVLKTFFSPALSLLLSSALVLYTSQNFYLLIGDDKYLTITLQAIVYSAFGFGFLYASYLSRNNKDVFSRIGRARG